MKKIPWWQPEIGKKEQVLVSKVLKDAFPNEGKLTIEFQNRISKMMKVKHAIAVPNATSAMYLVLKAFNIGPGDEVIVPDLTFIATANAVEMTGAKAILADTLEDNLTLDPVCCEKLISKKTKAIIPVHVSGRSSEIKKFIQIGKKYKIVVLEDAAEAFMSKNNKQYLGTFGDAGCFSFSPAKTITTGQGGMIVTNNTKLFKRLVELKDQGRDKRGTGGDDIHSNLGFNFKFTDIQAAVGLGQLTYVEKRMKRLARNHFLYKKYLKGVSQIRLLPFNLKSGELPLWTDAVCENRDRLDAFLQKNNADCRRFWHPIHTQAYYKTADNKFPVSTLLSPKTLWLPSAFTLNDHDIKYVAGLIKKFYGSNTKS